MERYYEAIDLLKGMISRPSFSRDETAVADFLQAEWKKAGQKVFRKGNNLWIIAPDFDFGKPTLLLNSHIDTSTINPFSATAGCIPVGSPTTAKEIGGSSANALSMPFFPDTSSSQDARKIRL